jgi:hypothetical protein
MRHGKVTEACNVQSNWHVVMGFVIDDNSFLYTICMYFDICCGVCSASYRPNKIKILWFFVSVLSRVVDTPLLIRMHHW